ncbi:hypothetical protein C0Q70_13629 [Pomacea canaliculata]|uniref:PDZ domain-containing protein n=1 Tax=Pomacea canaliculata TaxID=400727 RepID=A0A2T7NXU6_POMCA|nr:hypothetical protein C0Q70_13629 [Pomacea canaliculata]
MCRAFDLRCKGQAGCFICPKRTRKASCLQEEPPSTQYHVNPAFVDNDSLADAEEGIIGLTPKKGLSPEKKSPITDGYKKTWTSFPSPDFPDGLHRHVSCGSLDDNFRHMGPEMVSVWLQSQDIIGLGFNISGNMRDGIYVSQVHNRGPAVESGKIKVGDRIVSVTIAYENIVYEDALTILSYASPYPVKVTVQKERSGSSDPRSGSSEQLKHPIYRSQSLDALQRIKDPAFRPKRSQSEMKTETRKESDKRQRPADRKSKGLSQTYSSPPPSTAHSRNEVTADVMVHVPNLGHHDGQEGGGACRARTLLIIRRPPPC